MTVMKGALEAMGFTVEHRTEARTGRIHGRNKTWEGDRLVFSRGSETGVFRDGVLTIAQRDRYAPTVTEAGIKCAYSAECVKTAARKWGWLLKQTSQNQFVAQKGAM
jgi:hypothetical protein